MNEKLISAKDLTIKYGENTVISRANFEILNGDFICLVGANGSGKSTLVRAMLGLIKPAAGSIIYGSGIKKTAIGYLPQEAKIERNFPATVHEIVLSGNLGKMGARPFYGKTERQKSASSLDLLGITDLKKQSFGDLSGGQKQKVLLARALVATSRLLFLDEPSNNLDYASRKEFYQILRRLNRDSNLTIVMITHDLDADDLIGDKVLAIDDGKISHSTTKTYLENYR